MNAAQNFAEKEKANLLTVSQAADFLGVSIDSLRRWDKKGTLSPIRTPGGQRRYSKEQLEAFAHGKSQPIITPPQAETPVVQEIPAVPPQPQLITPQPITPIIVPMESVPSLENLYKLHTTITSIPNAVIRLYSGIELSYIRLPISLKTATLGAAASFTLILGMTLPHFFLPVINLAPPPALFTAKDVLGEQASSLGLKGNIIFNVPSVFNSTILLRDNVKSEDKNIDLGKGQLTASNVVYSVTGGSGISISGTQTPVITNSDPGSSQNIFKNIKIDSTTLSAGSNTDTFTIAAGSNITLSTDTTNKKVTITGASAASSGWEKSSSTVQLSTSSDSVKIQSLTASKPVFTDSDKKLTSSGTVGTTQGGTGLTGYTTGDILYTSATDTLSKLGIGSSGQILITSSSGIPAWSSAANGIVVVKSSGTTVSNASTLNFGGGDFSLTESPTGTANIALQATLQSVTGVAGNFDVAGTLKAGTSDAFAVSATGGITIPSTETLTIGSVKLSDGASAGSDSLAGANYIGVRTSGFTNSSSSNLQTVLRNLDSAIGVGSSKFTQATGFVYLTTTTDGLVLGASTAAASKFYFDTSNTTLNIGTDSTTNGTIRLYSSGAVVTDPTIAADASGNLLVTTTTNNFTTTSTGINSTPIGATTPAAGSFTTLSSTQGTTLASSSGNTAIGNSGGTLQLTSSGGLNVSTGGALTGVASLDTITTSSTALTFTSTVPTISVSTAATNIILDAGTTGKVQIANGSTGDVEIAGGSGSTGCTITNSNGNLACTGTITTTNTSGAVGFWTRDNATTSLSPTTSGDSITTTGNISTAGSGTITSAGLLTGSAGITVTGGTANINASGTNATNIGNSTGVLTLASGGTSAWTNTSGGLTISTATSGTLALTSAGALNLTANAASTFDLGASHTLSLQTTNNGAITTGTGLLTQGGNITFSGTSTRTITGPSTGGLTTTVDSGPLTLSTTTSGTLALSSAGALNLTGGAASTWNFGANNITLTAGNINTTATGINNTAIGATTASTGSFTTLTTSSTVTLNNTSAGSGSQVCLDGSNHVVTCASGSGVSGSGTQNVLSKFNNAGGTSIGDSSITDTASTLSFTKEVNKTLQIADSTSANTIGATLTIKGAAGGATNAAGGPINITGGAGAGTQAGGALAITGGAGGTTGAGGAITITTGAGGGASGNSGNLTLDTGSVSSGTAGTISFGTSNTSGITIGRSGASLTLASGGTSAWTNTSGNLTISTATSGTLALSSAGNLTLSGSNVNLSSAGVLTLAGAQTADITTTAGSAPTALVFQPGNNTSATGTGANFTLQAGNENGTTTATGGTLTLQGGNATGASGTRTGGAVTIDSGSGASAGGAITLGGTNAASIGLGRSGITTTITGLTTLAPSSAAALTINQYSTSAGATGELRLMEGGAGSTQYTGFKAPDGLSANLLMILPSDAGGSNYVLTTNGSGTLSWSATGAGGVGGSVTSVTAANGLGTAASTQGGSITTTGSLYIVLSPAAATDTATNTSTGSGLEFDDGNRISLLKGCANNEVLAWNSGSGVWNCNSVSGVGALSGSGTTNKLAKFTSSTAIGNSVLSDDGTTLTLASAATTVNGFSLTGNSLTSGLGLAVSSSAASNFTGSLIDVNLSDGTGASSNTGTLLSVTNAGTANANTTLYLKHYATGTGNLAMRVDDVSGDTTPFVIDGAGNVGIGTTAPAEALDVNGRIRIADSTAPGTTTNKLYSVTGTLTWNGSAICLNGGACASIGTVGINGTPAANQIAIWANATDIKGNSNYTIDSSGGTYAVTHTSTATTGNAYGLTATSLTTGKGLSLTTSSNPAGAGTYTANLFDITAANSSAADTFNGILYKFTNNPTVAGNTENAFQIQNQVTTNITDNSVASLLLLDNADTNGTGSTVVADALRITNSGAISGGITNGINLAATTMTNGINFSSDPATNYVTSGNWTVSSAGAETLASNLAVNGGSVTTSQTTGNLFNATATTVNLGGGATAINIGATSGSTVTFAQAGTIKSTTTSALTLDSGTTGNVNLGTGNNAKTIAIGTGNAGNTINIGTDNTVADTIGIGSALDTLTIAGTTGITGATTINGSGAAATNIGTGTYSGTVTIGRTSATDLVLNDANWNVSGAGAANFASIGATTAGTGSFTTLTTSSTVTLNSTPSGSGSQICLNGSSQVVTCSAGSGGVTSSGGTTNVLAKFTGAQAVGDSSITDTAASFAFTKEVTKTIQIADTTSANTAGSTLTIKGAAGAGSGAGGALNLTAGAAGATGTGGGITLTTGAGGGSSGASGALTLTTGTTSSGNSGAISIDPGSATGGTNGALTLGGTNAASIGIGRSGVTTTITGALTQTTGNVSLNGGSNTGTTTIGNSAAGALTLASGAASSFIVTGSTLSLQTTGANALTLNSGGALTFTGNAASTWDIGNNTLSIQTTNNGPITTGTGLFTSGGNVTFSGTSARTITGPSTGGLTETVASGPLTLSTTTSGTIAVTSAGALNLTGAAASTWQTTAGTLAITSAGALNETNAAASTYSSVANTASSYRITDGTNAYLTLDTRTGTSAVSALTFATGTAPSIASAASARFNSSTFTPGTVTLTGLTQVTGTGTTANNAILFNQPTIQNNNASGLTVDQASNVFINGADIATDSNGSGTATITAASALRIGAGSTLAGSRGAVTRGYGLYVDAPTGAATNYAAVFAGGNVGIGTTAPTTTLDITGTLNVSSTVNLASLTASKAVFTDASKNLTSTGTIAVGQGGTGVTTFGGTNTILYTTAADTLASITTGNTGALVTSSAGAPSITTGTANQVLRVNSAGTAVAFGAIDISQSAAVTGTLAVGNGGTGLSSGPTANGQLLIGTSTGTWAKQVLNSTGGTTDSGITITNGANTIDVALGNLTTDWVQAGAFNIKLDSATSRLKMKSGDGAAFYGTLDLATITADKTYTLPSFTGSTATICLTTGNCSGVGGSISGSGTASQVAFFTTGSNISSDSSLNIDSTNHRVGIGTTTPATLLNFFGESDIALFDPATITVDSDTNNSPIIRLRGTYDSDPLNTISSANQSFDLRTNLVSAGASPVSRFSIANVNNAGSSTELFSILNSGNVGIGNTIPLTALDITGSASVSANLSYRGQATAHTENILNNGTLNIQRSPGGDAGLATALFIQNNGNIGIGTTAPGAALDISTTSTNTASNYISARIMSSQTTTNTAAFYGLSSEPRYTAASGNTLATFYGIVANPISNNTGTVTNAYGLFTRVDNTSTGTIGSGTNGAYGVYIANPSNTGTIATNYGLKIENMTAGSTNYSIFSAGGTNYFAGNVGIGNSTPLTALDVTGSASVSANLSLRGAATAHTFNVLDNGTLNIQRSPGGDAGLATALFIQNNGNIGIGTTAPGARLDVTDTSNTLPSLKVTNNTLTTLGNGSNTTGAVEISSTTLSTGKLVNLDTGSANALTTGTLLNLYSQSTGLSSGTLLSTSYQGTAAFTGNLNYFDYSPSSAPSTSPTGDILRINLGSSGTNFTGNLFNVFDNSSSLFSISKTAATTNIPANFTSSGDVGIAYDLNFTNPTASFIKSLAPITIQSGETFNSSDLTLKTFNSGAIILDSGITTGTTTTSGVIALNSALTTGTGVFITSPTVTTGKLLDVNTDTYNTLTTGTLVNIASSATSGGASGSSYLLNLSRTGANASTAHTAYGISSSVTNTNGTSGTNVAGYFTASGATTANYSVQTGNITAVASAINAQVNLGTISGTAASSTNYGINIGAISSTGTINTALNIGALSGGTTTKGVAIGALSGATSTGVDVGNLSGTTANRGILIGAITAAATANNFGVDIDQITSQASATSASINTAGFATGAGTATYGIFLGANASTATTNEGIDIGAISGTHAASSGFAYGINIGAISAAGTTSTNAGINIGNFSNATTSKGIAIGTNSSATATGIDIGALSGTTANTGVKVGAISGTGTGVGVDIGANSATGATQYGVNIGAISGASATNNIGVNIAAVSGSSGTNYAIKTAQGSVDITDNSNTVASLALTNNTATTIGAGLNTLGVVDISSISLTTGNLVNLETTTTLTTGKMLNISSTSTALTTGSLLSLDWSPGSATAATGNLFNINIGSSATTFAGNLLNVADNGSSLFSVSKTAVTTTIPANFTSSGDVSIAYDINLTNPTSSFIKSAAPLTLQAGETFNSSNLSLKTFNQGSIVFDVANTTTTALDLTNSTLTTGTGFNAQFDAISTGTGFKISSSSTSQTSDTLLSVAQTGISTGYTGTVASITSSSTTGAAKVLSVVGDSISTSGIVLNVSAAALTTGQAVSITAGGATALTSGEALLVTGPTGAAAISANSGVVKITAAGALTTQTGAGSGGLLDVQGNGIITGTLASISDTAVMTTTGNLLSLTANAATTTTGLLTVNSTGLTTGYSASIALGTALTTGGALNVTAASYNHGSATETGSLINLAITDATNGTATSTTNGIDIASTINVTTGASGTKTINAIKVEAPTKTACTGGSTCTWAALNIADPGTLANTTLYSILSNGGIIKNNSTSSVILSNAALATTATDGFVYIQTSAGAPTGVPTTQTGTVAMEYDTTNNKLMVYNGAWKSSTFADVAEWAPAAGAESGDVVSLTDQPNPINDPASPFMLGKTNSSYDQKIIGVISQYAEEANMAYGYKKSEDYHALTLAGRVPVKVSTESGVIKKGDYLTSSSTPGVAMKATKPGQMIGKALEDFSCGHLEGEQCQGKILVFINVGFADPNSMLAKLTFASDGSLVVPQIQADKVIAKDLTVNGTPVTATATASADFSTADLSVNPQFQSLSSKVDSLTIEVANLKEIVKTSTISAALLQPTPLISSTSATLSQQLEQLDVQTATVSGTLMVLGRTTLSDLGVTGDITTGVMSIHGLDGSIDTFAGDLKLQSQGLGGIDILNGKILIAKDGTMTTQDINAQNITAKTVTTDKLTITQDTTATTSAVLSSSAGSILLKAGVTTIKVQTDMLTPKSLVFTTPDSPVAVGTKILDKKTFTITLKQALTEDLKVNWWIIN